MLFTSYTTVLMFVLTVSSYNLPLLDTAYAGKLSKRSEAMCYSCETARKIVMQKCIAPNSNDEAKAFSCICHLDGDFWEVHSNCSKECRRLDEEDPEIDLSPIGIQDIYCRVAYDFPKDKPESSKTVQQIFGEAKRKALKYSNDYSDSKHGRKDYVNKNNKSLPALRPQPTASKNHIPRVHQQSPDSSITNAAVSMGVGNLIYSIIALALL